MVSHSIHMENHRGLVPNQCHLVALHTARHGTAENAKLMPLNFSLNLN